MRFTLMAATLLLACGSEHERASTAADGGPPASREPDATFPARLEGVYQLPEASDRASVPVSPQTTAYVILGQRGTYRGSTLYGPAFPGQPPADRTKPSLGALTGHSPRRKRSKFRSVLDPERIGAFRSVEAPPAHTTLVLYDRATNATHLLDTLAEISPAQLAVAGPHGARAFTLAWTTDGTRSFDPGTLPWVIMTDDGYRLESPGAFTLLRDIPRVNGVRDPQSLRAAASALGVTVALEVPAEGASAAELVDALSALADAGAREIVLASRGDERKKLELESAFAKAQREAKQAKPTPAPAPAPVALAPTVKVDKVELLSGDFDSDAVAAKIRGSYSKQFLRCYTAVLRSNPGLMGRIELTIRIGSASRVTAVDVSGFDASLDACVKAAAAKWVFDNPMKVEAEFVITLILKPR